jgi:hypothetical protein
MLAATNAAPDQNPNARGSSSESTFMAVLYGGRFQAVARIDERYNKAAFTLAGDFSDR